MLKCQMVESISASLKYSSAHTSAEQCSTKRETIFWLFCCFRGIELAEELGVHTSLWHMAKNTYYLSLLFLLRDTKEKKIHGLYFIIYSCSDWGERKPHGLPFIHLKKINQRMEKWVTLHIKDMIQNTYLVSQSAYLCLSLRIYNSCPVRPY